MGSLRTDHEKLSGRLRKGDKMANAETVETTLGDLIVALNEETAPFVRGEAEVNKVVAYILADLLYHSRTASKNRPVSIHVGPERKILVVH